MDAAGDFGVRTKHKCLCCGKDNWVMYNYDEPNNVQTLKCYDCNVFLNMDIKTPNEVEYVELP